MPIQNLSNHPVRYVTVAELAEYWAVSRHQIYKQIESGALEALRFGPRLYRVPTSAALRFERAVGVSSGQAAFGRESLRASQAPTLVRRVMTDKPQREAHRR
jgi:excisionase family DNA binding protein